MAIYLYEISPWISKLTSTDLSDTEQSERQVIADI